jgi:hypothetical protein
MKTHSLKCWPQYLDPLLDGRKTFDVRVDDGRGFEVGDTLVMTEWNPHTESYGDRVASFTVTYLMRGGDCVALHHIPPNVVVMAVELRGFDVSSDGQGGDT